MSLAEEIEKLGPVRAADPRRRAAGVRIQARRRDRRTTRVFDLSNALRARGWQLPAYTFPKNRTDLAALRVVVRRGVTHDLADLLISDIKRELARARQAVGSRAHERQLDELPPLDSRFDTDAVFHGFLRSGCRRHRPSASGG